MRKRVDYHDRISRGRCDPLKTDDGFSGILLLGIRDPVLPEMQARSDSSELLWIPAWTSERDVVLAKPARDAWSAGPIRNEL